VRSSACREVFKAMDFVDKKRRQSVCCRARIEATIMMRGRGFIEQNPSVLILSEPTAGVTVDIELRGSIVANLINNPR